MGACIKAQACIKGQRGWTFSGLLAVLVVVGIFVGVAFKLAPAYTDFYTLESIMESVIQDRRLLAKPNTEVKLSIRRRMGINNLKLPQDFLSISRDKGTVHLDVDYEIRTPIFHNVDAVMSFKKRYSGQEVD